MKHLIEQKLVAQEELCLTSLQTTYKINCINSVWGCVSIFLVIIKILKIIKSSFQNTHPSVT